MNTIGFISQSGSWWARLTPPAEHKICIHFLSCVKMAEDERAYLRVLSRLKAYRKRTASYKSKTFPHMFAITVTGSAL